VSDPNWFYSTLAQSTAAIVGLAGAFLAARLIAHRGEMADERAGLLAEFRQLSQNVRQAERDSAAFLAGIANVVTNVSGSSKETQEPPVLALGNMLSPLGVSMIGGWSMPGTMGVTEGVIAALEEARPFGAGLYEELSALSERELARRLRDGESLTPKSQAWLGQGSAQLPDSRDYWELLDKNELVAQWVWDRIREQYERLNAELRTFRSRLVPSTTIVLIALLGSLLIAGTIVPMAALSAHPGGGKTALLTAFSVLAIGVVGLLAYEVWKIRQAADLSRDTF
jgi:hypothetical protein